MPACRVLLPFCWMRYDALKSLVSAQLVALTFGVVVASNSEAEQPWTFCLREVHAQQYDVRSRDGLRDQLVLFFLFAHGILSLLSDYDKAIARRRTPLSI